MTSILICDDVHGRAVELERLIAAGASGNSVVAVAISPEPDLLASIDVLRQRRDDARLLADKPDTFEPRDNPGATVFDGVDIVVLDYDLFWLGVDPNTSNPPAPRSRLTGEQLSYLVRSYTDVAYVVAVNQFGENSFDLNLRGHLDSYADLNIGGKQIGHAGLWGDSFKGFQPWVWPNLFREVEAIRQRTLFVEDNWDTAILEAFGLAEAAERGRLDREVVEFLGPQGALATFRDFSVAGAPSSLDRTDRKASDAHLARLVASRIGKWLDREILSGQELLLDAPHLVERYPSVFRGDLDDLDQDASLGLRDISATYDQLGLDEGVLAEAEFASPLWLSRRAWRGDLILAQRRVAEVADPFAADDCGFRFCEDASRFVRTEHALAFTSEVHSTFLRRHVAGPRELSRAVTEHPQLYTSPDGIVDVDYRPHGRLES